MATGSQKTTNVAGGTKPSRRTRRRFKAGAKTSGGIGSRPRAGPGRAGKRRPVGTKGIQLQRRMKHADLAAAPVAGPR